MEFARGKVSMGFGDERQGMGRVFAGTRKEMQGDERTRKDAKESNDCFCTNRLTVLWAAGLNRSKADKRGTALTSKTQFSHG